MMSQGKAVKEFEIVSSAARQREIKPLFQKLFVNAFGRPISDREWEHYYLNCPLGTTVSFAGYEAGEMIAHGGLIPQRLTTARGEAIDYYLQTAIMVDDKHRTLVLFKDLLDAMGSFVSDKGRFSLAYPNKNTFMPFVKLLGWKLVVEYDIKRYLRGEGADDAAAGPFVSGRDSWLLRDDQFMKWRGELNGMRSVRTDEYELIYKDYEGSLEMLDLKTLKSGLRLDAHDIMSALGFDRVNIPDFMLGCVSLKGLKFDKTVGIRQRMCVYPRENDMCRYEGIMPSLLLSDVF